MNDAFDLLIVGASFEGLCLANYFALNKKKVAIIESNPIKKIGENDKSIILSEKTLGVLKDFFQIRVPSKFIENSFKSFSINFGEKNQVIESESYLVNEKMLVFYLIGKIIELENVSFFEKTEFLELLSENKRIIGAKVKSKNIESITAKIIVDASGNDSVVRRGLKDNSYFSKFSDEKITYPYYEELVENINIHGLNFFIEPEKKDLGFFSVIPKNDGKAIIRLSVFDKIVDPVKYLKEFREKNFKESRVVQSIHGKYLMNNPFYGFCYQNVLLIGSSALQTNSFLKEDCSLKINACVSICKELINASSINEIYTNDLWKYNASFMRKHGYKLNIFGKIKGLIADLEIEEIEYLIGSGKLKEFLDALNSSKISKSSLLSFFLKPVLMSKLMRFYNSFTKLVRAFNEYPEYDDFVLWKNNLNDLV